MPELPEVETTKASLAPLIGHTITQVHCYQPRLRELAPNDLDSLVGFRLASVTRRAKYLIARFVNTDGRSKSLLIHLGMSGSLQQHLANTPPTKHDHLTMTLVAAQGAEPISLRYHDPRRFGMILWAHNDDYLPDLGEPSLVLKSTHDDDPLIIDQPLAYRYLAHLGVEPLDDAFDANYLFEVIHHPRPIHRPIKSVIMEQTIVVGVGNIYATESLFLSGVHPATPARCLSLDQLERLVHHIKHILAQAIAQGGTTLKDFASGHGKTGYFQQVLLAYGRQRAPCTICQTPLEIIKIAGRASVYCPNCQPPH